MKRIMSNIALVLTMAVLFSVNVSAAIKDPITKTIDLPKNQKWVSCSATRTGDYDFCYAKCQSVYSTTSSDNFTRIQARVVNSSGTRISVDSKYILSEKDAGSAVMNIKRGYLSAKSIKFQFRGNKPEYAARAKVFYNAM